MKYKVGDKVRVREDLVVDETYGNETFVSEMKRYLGKTMTVNKIFRGSRYKLKEDNDQWNWTDEMLEDVESINIIVEGNKVIAKKGNRVGVAKCSPEDKFDIFVGARLAIDRLEEKYKPYSWLKKGATYYFPRVDLVELYDYYSYDDDNVDERFTSRGIVFKTKEEAIECAKKMLEVVK